MYYLFVRTGDIDGDGRDEIVTNQYIWEDLFISPGNLAALVDEVATLQLDEDATIRGSELLSRGLLNATN